MLYGIATRAYATTAALLLAGSLWPASLRAQAHCEPRSDSEPPVVQIDQVTETARLLTYKGGRIDTVPLGRAKSVRLERPATVAVCVVNTNTAIYNLTTESTASNGSDAQSVQSFLGKLGPYLPEFGLALAGPQRSGSHKTPGKHPFLGTTNSAAFAKAMSESHEAASAALRQVEKVRTVVYGAGGLSETYARSLTALDQMRNGTPAEQASAPVRDLLHVDARDCQRSRTVRLPASTTLLTAYDSLVRSTAALDTLLPIISDNIDSASRPSRDSLVEARFEAQSMLGGLDSVVSRAYHVEHLAAVVASACSTWSAGRASGSWSGGRSLTITVQPRPEPEAARVADRGTTTYRVSIAPRAVARPSLGLSAILSPSARFPTYATRPASGGQAEVYESGLKDARFSWGVTLGMSWPRLQFRHDAASGGDGEGGGGSGVDHSGISIWLPELTVGSSSDTKAFGVGTAISWSFVKLGTGALWVRHPRLDDLDVGQIVPNSGYLRTTDVYGRPRYYVSLSVFDVAPFSMK